MKYSTLVLLSTVSLSLAACAGDPKHGPVTSAPPAVTTYQTSSASDLPTLEDNYKRDPSNANAAVRYSAALENAGRTRRALMVLTPFVNSGKADNDAALLTRYAAAQAAIGDNDAAADAARQAVAIDPQEAEASYILGRALEAGGDHLNAEVALRQALVNWQGNPSPVLNDLGLNLAGQGLLDEAIATLKKAIALSPGQADYERNLRIVQALQSQPGTHGVKLVPPPAPKPPIS